MMGWLFILFISVFTTFVIFGAKDSLDRSTYCREKGGVPVTDRGVYKACAKPDSYIILDSDK